MVIYLDAYISELSLHLVGNKIADDGIKLSKNTIYAYNFAIKQFFEKFSILNRKNLMSYKS